jgi:hypothetical protein
MAKRSSSKPYAKPTEAPKAKRHKKPKGAHKKKTLTGLTNVCVVSVIPFAGTQLETSFKTGLGSYPVTYKPPMDNLGYNTNTLKAAVQQAGGDGATLVVTMGGLIAAIAAKQAGTTIPFISLAGGTTSFYSGPTRNFKGGLNLNALGNDATYNSYLENLRNITQSQIGLLYNPNSGISSVEPNIYPSSQPAAIDQSTSPTVASGLYTTAFGRFSSSVKAVIVSPDPFFAQTAQQLVAAANSSSFWILYPSSVYLNYSPTHCTIYPPANVLSALCQTMGSTAVTVASAQTATYTMVPLGTPSNIP